ncbi:MAG: dienelactone hydrolase, partial [Sphingobacteriaceae bacterium]|nr:dienelactone hydrolase [Cytophagaceae bacterium]
MLLFLLLLRLAAPPAPSQTPTEPFIFGDLLPDAPELAPRGPQGVGVRTLTLTDKGRVDVLHAKSGEAPRYDRPLTLEI